MAPAGGWNSDHASVAHALTAVDAVRLRQLQSATRGRRMFPPVFSVTVPAMRKVPTEGPSERKVIRRLRSAP
jgi:hypothetical protein